MIGSDDNIVTRKAPYRVGAHNAGSSAIDSDILKILTCCMLVNLLQPLGNKCWWNDNQSRLRLVWVCYTSIDNVSDHHARFTQTHLISLETTTRTGVWLLALSQEGCTEDCSLVRT